MSKTTEISVVIPVKNEAGNIDTLVSEIHQSLKKFSYEIIYVNDGSEDNTELELKNNMKNNKKLRVVSHENCQGQSAALRTGIKSSNSTSTVLSNPVPSFSICLPPRTRNFPPYSRIAGPANSKYFS